VHPMQYLAGLAEEATRRGVQIFENTKVTGVEEGEPCHVITDTHPVRARHVFVAANVPVNNRVFLHTKVAAYRSYAIAAEIEPDRLRGLYWDTADPYHYTRTQEVDGRWYVIIGGEDHRTGEKKNTDECFQRLVEYARERLRFGDIAFRWSGQIIEPVDGLPYIGRNTGADHVFVATGYSGNGITFGTLAGMMVTDLIRGRENPYAELFEATRVKPLAAAYDYVAENVPFPMHLAQDRLTSTNADIESLDELRPGDGGIFVAEEGKLAVYRDERGQLHACSPICTHLACDVNWNRAEKTWDCPCHGSRFSPEGKVINGPAVSDLAPAKVPAHQ
jgi:Rieske Fe-S protein